MKRRRFFQAVVAAPALPVLAPQPAAVTPQATPTPPPPSQTPPPAPGAEELPKIETTGADAVGNTVTRFFNPQQFAALRKLSEILMPPVNGAPGALEAGAPEFLDFLIGESPAERQQVYRAGLDALNSAAKKQFKKAFSEVDAEQANTLLAPLRQPWSYDPPSDPLARFLMAAKADVRTATVNSREWAAVASAGGGRRGAGVGLYWYPIE
jgi:hypothetical protein